ncbi:MAG: glutamate transporter substrate-binding protein [Micrococcaceae bacterium]|jgi:glutamate transport system substrate-binding protein|uniref:Glutamate ABC transporter substrate-binding protein n=1 Tax=Arthrobacter cheniae TaxID=1258888 RepID=A0A3A5M237_9MICC|nr:MULTISPECIES: glutamate ABC transporter substrate-binding protein [Arthrobacter]MCU1633523.1 glutamate transporter substrate-binding protein [Micrococcaceae bacterium]MEC5197942.1 glutamate transport system substrate-binding protein [Arthrobacter sp. PL16]RJT78348.1 glutamate ABC transporter substrate-binding protein [Arthrobacter cheniae]
MQKTRYAAAALAAVAALTLSACGGGDSAESESGSSAEAGGESLRIGIKFDQPGLGYDEGGSYSGFDVDVAKYVANELGVTEENIEWVEAPSANRENLLSNNQVDMIFATYSITDTRKEVVDFAGPYFVAGQDLLVPTDSDIAGPEDLEGKNLCSVTGSTSAQKIKDQYPGVQLVEQPGYAECVTAMGGGQIDAVTTDDIILAGLAAQEANAGKFKVVGNTFSEENYGVGLPKGSDRCEAVNEAITKMIDDGAWDEAITSNTEGADYTFNAELNPPTPAPCA